MTWLRTAAVLALIAGPALPAPAAFVAVANHTDREVRFTLVHPGAEPRAETLAVGEGRLVPVGRQPEVSFTAGGKVVKFGLTPYTAYVFTEKDDAIALHGVELAAALPKPGDVPVKPPATGEPLRVTTHLLVDDADARARAVWEKALRQRVAAASDVLERQCGVKLDVVTVGEWASDPGAADFDALAADFEKKVSLAKGATVAIGYTSRAIRGAEDTTATLTGCGRGPLRPHVLVRERHPRTEAERVEILVHEVAHFLGAAHTPDPQSAMRPKLGDARAAGAKYRVGLDPLNLLAVGVWAEAVRGGNVKTWDDLKPAARDRLRAIYKTLARLAPDDPVALRYLNALAAVRDQGAVAPDPGPVGAKPAAVSQLSPRQEAVRKVVRAATQRATDLAKLAPADRPKGDKLTADLVRAAANAAVTLDDALQTPAFLVGLGVALDDSTTLQDNPLTGRFCKPIESEAERRERTASLGVPTVRHRRDLCQHFVVSAALADLLGPGPAEAAGVTKELLDLRGDSGFSFADLTADFAGVAFAKQVTADRHVIERYRDGFKVEDFVPAVTDVPDGLTPKQFAAGYGGVDDPRFLKATDEVRRRVAEMPGFRK